MPGLRRRRGRADPIPPPDPEQIPSDREPTSAVAAATVEHLDCRVLTIPTDAPEADGTIAWDKTTMVLVTARSGDTTGLGWTYGPSACASLIHGLFAPLVVGTLVR